MGDIEKLLKESAAAVAKMTPVERELMLAEQARSWTRGNMGMVYPHMSKEELDRLVPRNVLADEIERLRTESDTAYFEGVKAGLEAAKAVAEQYEGKPCKPAPGWSEVEVEGFYVGQLDASTSIAAGISSLDPATITRKGGADG